MPALSGYRDLFIVLSSTTMIQMSLSLKMMVPCCLGRYGPSSTAQHRGLIQAEGTIPLRIRGSQHTGGGIFILRRG